MPRIPIESGGGEIEFKFIPKSEGEAKKPAKKSSNWRSEFEKGLRFVFYSFIILLGLYLVYQKFAGSESKSVSVANAGVSNVKSTEGDPWAQAQDVNGDGFIEAWEGIK